MAHSSSLVEVADHLKTVAASEAPHEESFFRRSISTSYYAAFAGLCEAVAAPYLPDVAFAAQRLMSHTQARDVCDKLANKGSTMPWLVGKPECEPCIRGFAVEFVRLQLHRMRADYDPLFSPKKRDASMAVKWAKASLVHLDTAASSCPEQLQTICIASVTQKQVLRRLGEHT